MKTTPLKSYYFTIFALLFLYTTTAFAQIPENYYSAADGLSGEVLKSALNNIIKGHVEYPYTSTATDVWDILKESDRDPNNPDNVILLYTGWSVNAAQEYNNTAGWTREHVWAKSRGNFGTDRGAGTDCHHLRPADVSVNSARNNRWFAECDEPYYDDGGTILTESFTSSTEWVWEPRAAVKGDVARMIFYMATRYEGLDGEPDLEIIDYLPADDNTLEPIHAKLSDLIAWHLADPVDDFERNRNEVVYGYQLNRNPFIDHPEFVEYIWGEATPVEETPIAPALAINATSSDITLNWTDLTNETGYKLYKSTNGSSFNLLADLNQNTNTYSDHAVVEGTTYYYYAAAYNAVGQSPNSSTVSASLEGTTPVALYATELIISEYVEGSSYNKGIEIANFTGQTVDLSQYIIKKQTNGAGDWVSDLALSGTLNHGETYVLVYNSASAEMQAYADLVSTSSSLTFNGNDAVALFNGANLVDVVGIFNSADVFAQDKTLVRKSAVTAPNTTYDASEWDVYTIDSFTDLGTHTMDLETTEPTDTQAPTAPATLLASNITETTVDLSWTASIDNVAVDAYDVYMNGTFLATTANTSYHVFGLTASTPYSFYVKAKDAAQNVSVASNTANVQTLDEVVVVEYCDLYGSSTTFEWIDYIEVASLVNSSAGSGGYADYTNMTADLAMNSTNSIYISAGFKRRFYTEYWKVWIDFNQDGIFDDATELVVTGSTAEDDIYEASFDVPANAQTGQTRMRVAMSDHNGYSSCGSFKYGEVEDYTVNITTDKTLFASNLRSEKLLGFDQISLVNLYPNPTADFIQIELKGEGQTRVELFNLYGAKLMDVQLSENNPTIDLRTLPYGTYIVNIHDQKGIISNKIIKR